MLVDSHCHLDKLDLAAYNNDLSSAINAAKEKGVEHFLCVGIDLEHLDDVMGIANEYSAVSASVGVHPLYQESRDPDVEELVTAAQHEKVVAIGETGLDYFYCKGDLAWQRKRFEVHIEAAQQSNLPLIIHTRDAKEDTLAILRAGQADKIGGVLHCFTEDLDMAEQAMEMGFYISISGIVTFRNADALREVVRAIPADRLLVETDSPYLAPVPHRGKSNEPKYVVDVAKFIADLKEMPVDELVRVTGENFFNLFSKAQKQVENS